MRIQAPNKHLNTVLERLKLRDEGLARRYLTGEVGDEVLPQFQKQEFGYSFYYSPLRGAMAEWIDRKQDRAERALKLCWAVGASTGIYALPHRMAYYDEKVDAWMGRVLGEAELVAMRAEQMARGAQVQTVERIRQIARKRPQVVEKAYTLCGSTADNMRVFLAGLLLASGARLSNRQMYLDMILENNISSLDGSMGGATPEERRALAQYLRDGDPRAALPPVQPRQMASNVGKILQVYVADHGLAALLGAASFAAVRESEAARCALRMYLTCNPRSTLDGIFASVDPEYLRRMFPVLIEEMPFGKAAILLYLAIRSHEQDEYRRRWALLCVEGLAEAYDYANFNEKTVLQSLLPLECRALGRTGVDDITSFLSKTAEAGGAEIEAFLRGSGSLANTQAELSKARGNTYAYLYQAMEQVRAYRRGAGWDDFACRAVLVAALVYKSSYCSRAIFEGYGFVPEQMEMLCDALAEKELPLGRMLDVLGVIYDSTGRNEVMDFTLKRITLAEHLPELRDAVTNSSVYTRQMAVRALDALGDKALLKACADSSKQIKEVLLEVLPKHPEWAEDYARLLSGKKAAERLLAVELLARFGRRDLLEGAMAGEKNAKVLDAIRAKVGAEAPALEIASAQDLAARVLKGNKIRKLSWLTEKPLPMLHREDGTEVGEDIRNAMLLSYSELGRIGRSDTARELAEGICPGDLSALAVAVFELWMGEKAPAKHKWVLAFCAVFGGRAMTARLVRAINDWPNNARGAIACDGVFALALSDDPAALVTVDAMSRKFKFRQVKVAAGQALQNAARELGITAEELADRIVPTLGFGGDGKRIFDYGKRSFTVRLTPTLELAITNDQGKTVKNLPAPGKTDDEMASAAYEEFKAMKKQIKTTVSAQRSRLEAALSVSRCWSVERWRELFVGNPIMHQFAMSLIWGVYEGGALTDTFRYMEDGSFNTVDEEEYELPASGQIGLVHPVELDEETLEGWKQQLEDYEITQAIDQLSRPVYTLEDTDPRMRKLERFGGKVLNGLSLSGKLLGQGWYRGSVVDGGFYYDYYREDTGPNLAVELRFSGSPVGDENEDVTVFDAVFYRPGTVKRGSYVYDSIKPEHTLALGDIPARYFSEILHQLTRATASSTETNPDWRTMEGK